MQTSLVGKLLRCKREQYCITAIFSVKTTRFSVKWTLCKTKFRWNFCHREKLIVLFCMNTHLKSYRDFITEKKRLTFSKQSSYQEQSPRISTEKNLIHFCSRKIYRGSRVSTDREKFDHFLYLKKKDRKNYWEFLTRKSFIHFSPRRNDREKSPRFWQRKYWFFFENKKFIENN